MGCGVEKGHWRPEDGGESGVVKLLGSTDGAQVQEYRSKDHSYGLFGGKKDKQLLGTTYSTTELRINYRMRLLYLSKS